MFEPLFVRRIAVEKFWRKNFGAENLVFSGDRRNFGTVIYEQFFVNLIRSGFTVFLYCLRVNLILHKLKMFGDLQLFLPYHIASNFNCVIIF